VLTSFASGPSAPHPLPAHVDAASLRQAIWIDLYQPGAEEIALVEQSLGVELPTEADLAEIESSSRIYVANGALFLSMPLVIQSETDPRIASIGFVLTRERLVSIRFQPSRVFDQFIARLPQAEMADQSGARILVGLLESVVDRLADVMEKVRSDLDGVSRNIFVDDTRETSGRRMQERELQAILKTVGRAGDLTSRVRDTLLGVGRIVPYLRTAAEEFLPNDLRARLRTLRQDISSLNDYDVHLTNKVQFLLDATLGFISISQNDLMKVFTITSVAGIPPVLLAGIWGMNFKHMPELDWEFGYPLALLLIVLSATIPVYWFRRKGWL
jgi:magnesium transporter